MKRGIAFIFLLSIIILSSSVFVSASWWDKIIGNVINSQTPCQDYQIVYDPSNDIDTSFSGSLDLIEGSIQDTGNQLIFSIKTKNDISPEYSNPANIPTGYKWIIDTDLNSNTGEQNNYNGNEIGNEYNIKVLWDSVNEKWFSVVDKIGSDSFGVSNFKVVGNTAQVTINKSLIGNPSNFIWAFEVETQNKPNDQSVVGHFNSQNAENCNLDKCSDGTANGKCSEDKPNICNSGELETKCSVCGCLSDERCLPESVCIKNFCFNGVKDSDEEGVDCGDICLNSCGVNNENNSKDPSKYSNKETFLVSDEDWRAVLVLVPLSIWTNNDNSISMSPLLIYHKEGEFFDIDSIYRFLDQYNSNKVSYFGEIPSQLSSLVKSSNSINKIQNPLDYWSSYRDVVYVTNDYESALMASTYASLINAPLIIKGYNDNIDMTERNVICIGDNLMGCNKTSSLDQIQEEYLQLTNTDKIILTNPDDFNMGLVANFSPEYGANNIIKKAYSKTSLSSSILASSKHELILSTNQLDYLLTQSFLQSKIKALGIKPNFLTIVASPDSIDGANEWAVDGTTTYGETDNFFYGDINNDYLVDLAVGRIFGITSSDISGLIARSIYYSELDIPHDYSFFYDSNMNDFRFNRRGAIRNIFMDYGMTGRFYPIEEEHNTEDMTGSEIIVYSGHGGEMGWSSGIGGPQLREEKTYLDPAIIIANACSTCSYREAVNLQNRAISQEEKEATINLMCAQSIRRGAVAYIGAIQSVDDQFNEVLYLERLTEGDTIGEAMRFVQNAIVMRNKLNDWNLTEQIKHYHFSLFGDPTLKVAFQNIPQESPIEEVAIPNGKRIIFNIPSAERTEYYLWNNSDFHEYFFFEQVRSPYLFDQSIVYTDINKDATGDYVDEFGLTKLFVFKVNLNGNIQNINVDFDPDKSLSNLEIFGQKIQEEDSSYRTSFIQNGNEYYIAIEHRLGYNPGNEPSDSMIETFPSHKYYIDIITDESGGGTTSTTGLSNCNGCSLDGRCYNLGYRKLGQFCSENNQFVNQKDADEICDNNFECSSNLCIDGKCVSNGLWQKFLSWLQKLFG